MNNVSMFLLFLSVAVCSAARFPFQPRGKCGDCDGLTPNSVVGCYCSDLDHCASMGCTFGECSYAICDSTPARRALKDRAAEHRVLEAFSRREPNDCPDCEGFGAGCGCDAYDICKSEGCHTGECSAGNCGKRKRTMAGYLPKREPNDCPDCAGFAAGCPCNALEICESEGCHTGECTASNCGKRKRSMAAYLLKREPNDCPDCAGFGAGCPCDAYDLCKSEGCHTGECTASNCGKKKRTISDLLKRGNEICEGDCQGFGPGCPCGDALLCIEMCGSAGDCKSSNCSPTA